MAARAAGASPCEALIEALAPEIRAAIDDVDRTLIALAPAAIALGSAEVGVPDPPLGGATAGLSSPEAALGPSGLRCTAVPRALARDT